MHPVTSKKMVRVFRFLQGRLGVGCLWFAAVRRHHLTPRGTYGSPQARNALPPS
jgi:hypothetical protein